MSFWRNLKAIGRGSVDLLTATVGALSEATEMLAQEAEEFSMYARASRIEGQLRNKALVGDERKALVKELLELYGQLTERVSDREKQELRDKKWRLMTAEHAKEIEACKARITRLEAMISLKSDRSHAEHVLERRALISKYEQLLFYVCGREPGAIERIKTLKVEAEYHEKLRSSVRRTAYLSGKPKAIEHIYDGIAHGQCDYWYESGARLMSVSYNHGSPKGKLQHWRESGELLFECVFDTGAPNVMACFYSRSGIGLVEIREFAGNLHARLYLWNGARFGGVILREGRIDSLATLMVLSVFRPRAALTLLFTGKKSPHYPLRVETFSVYEYAAKVFKNKTINPEIFLNESERLNA